MDRTESKRRNGPFGLAVQFDNELIQHGISPLDSLSSRMFYPSYTTAKTETARSRMTSWRARRIRATDSFALSSPSDDECDGSEDEGKDCSDSIRRRDEATDETNTRLAFWHPRQSPPPTLRIASIGTPTSPSPPSLRQAGIQQRGTTMSGAPPPPPASCSSNSTITTVQSGPLSPIVYLDSPIPQPSSPNICPSPLDYVERGIDCHERNELARSTHYFRRAAEAGHPIGMLFYSLALRHGWGCAANQPASIVWLKRAVGGDSGELFSRKTLTSTTNQASRTLFGMALYELGQSYLRGWGVNKDEHLALQCFENSAAFGDADGMCEAARMWANGIGVPRNTKKHGCMAKAAGYYRQAIKQGVPLVGISWIWKDKYNPS